MLTFMDHVQRSFHAASNWDVNNSYDTLTATINSLLDFPIPRGVRFNVSSLSTSNFATSYTLGSRGVVDGSLSYLYTSLPLRAPSSSQGIDLRRLVDSYRQVAALRRPDERHWAEIWHRGRRVDRKDTLLYGRLHLPESSLEALYLRRTGPTRLLRLAAVSDSALPSGGALLVTIHNDYAKYSTEYLCSTDSALIGVRGLYNLGRDPRKEPRWPALSGPPNSNAESAALSLSTPPPPVESQHGRLSAGAEAYFSPINKSGGVSTAVRFTTLPSHAGFPYTMTLTLNPLMGNISSAWAAQAGQTLALCSRFDFNFYSYESAVQLGVELWRHKSATETESADRRPVESGPNANGQAVSCKSGPFDSVVKIKASQDWKIGVLWEGRIQGLLASIGADMDLKRKERIVGTVGVEISYSS